MALSPQSNDQVKVVVLSKSFSKDTFETIFKLYHAELLVIAKAYLIVEDAEEIVQNVFIKLWENRKTINVHTDLNGFLIRMTRNACLDHLRKLKRIKTRDRTLVLEQKANYRALADEASFAIIERELSEYISKVIAMLPPKRQVVFVKSRVNGLANKQIAEDLNISVNTVENHLTQAVKHMRSYLQKL